MADEARVVVVGGWSTICVRSDDLLLEKSGNPAYTAAIVCEPTDSDEVVSVACPDPSVVPVPNVVAPSLNVTVPVGIPAPEVTVAVKVTLCPLVEGFGDEVSDVLVAGGLHKPALEELKMAATSASVMARL